MSNTPIIQFPEPLEDPTQTEEVVVMGIANPGLSKLEPPSKIYRLTARRKRYGTGSNSGQRKNQAAPGIGLLEYLT